ncbi:hypothetical protein FM102_01090 [Corynebacterium glutamicum]|nr:hypothetical protein FM102_01090 [Corynebacterium glutamicum]
MRSFKVESCRAVLGILKRGFDQGFVFVRPDVESIIVGKQNN